MSVSNVLLANITITIGLTETNFPDGKTAAQTLVTGTWNTTLVGLKGLIRTNLQYRPSSRNCQYHTMKYLLPPKGISANKTRFLIHRLRMKHTLNTYYSTWKVITHFLMALPKLEIIKIGTEIYASGRENKVSESKILISGHWLPSISTSTPEH